MNQIYKDNGYVNREDYLFCLANDLDLDLKNTVRPLADLLGPDEDFDGLVTLLKDMVDE